MIILMMILTFNVLLHNFKCATEQYDQEDDYGLTDDLLFESPVYYHVKEATWVTSNDSSGKRTHSKLHPTRTTAFLTKTTTQKQEPEITTTISTSQSSSEMTHLSTKITSQTSSTLTTHKVIDFYARVTKQVFLNESTFKDYSNYSVLLITPGSVEQLEEILEYEYKNQNYNFWSHRRVFDSPLLVLLPPNDTSLRTTLRQHKIDYIILIENLESVLEFERKKLIKQIPPSLTGISFNMYLRYKFVMDYLKHLSVKYSEIARVINIGKTIEERDIALLEVKGKDSPEKIHGAIFIQAGIHGREWLGVSTALYAINQLVEHAAANKDMFDGIFWYILPIFNADGYEYSHTIDRLWKNNRRLYDNCSGVDLDRNFEVENLDNSRKLRDALICTNLYAGTAPGSEPETQALQRFIEKTKNIIKVYISLHSGDPFIGYPWAYKKERTTDYEQIVELATRIKNAIEKTDNSTIYQVERLYSICGKYDGAAIDWAKSEGISYPLMLSLKGGAFQGFDVPGEQIFDAVVAAFEGIKAIAIHLQTSEEASIVIEQTEDNISINKSNTVRFFVLNILISLIILSCK